MAMKAGHDGGHAYRLRNETAEDVDLIPARQGQYGIRSVDTLRPQQLRIGRISDHRDTPRNLGCEAVNPVGFLVDQDRLDPLLEKSDRGELGKAWLRRRSSPFSRVLRAGRAG